jgi:RimJ/RimL family protein N-acetyltransferase
LGPLIDMFDYQPRLTGRILTLRPVQRMDWQDLAVVGCDPQVWAGHPDQQRYLTANFKAYFEDGVKSGKALVALEKASGAVLGWSRYITEHAGPSEIEIGATFLGHSYWGGPWNAEMKQLMLRHAFQFVDRVIFRVGKTNGRSQRAVEKLGAVRLIGRPESVSHGVPYLFYGLNRTIFEAQCC